MRWHGLDERRARVVEAVCEAVVPGSHAVGPAVYVDSLVADWPEPQRAAFLEAVDALAPVLDEGEQFLSQVSSVPAFQWLRALAIEAYYSDFAQPGYDGPTAWDTIDFNSPEARRIRKDWSFLRCYQ